MRDLLTLALIGGPVAWAMLAYLGVFFAVGLYGLVSRFAADCIAIIQGVA
jgi:hypothetical protein